LSYYGKIPFDISENMKSDEVKYAIDRIKKLVEQESKIKGERDKNFFKGLSKMFGRASIRK